MFGFHNDMVPYRGGDRPDYLDNFWNEPFFGMFGGADIKTDIRETSDGYEVTAEVPGAAKGDIQVDYDRNDILSISVRRKEENHSEKNGFIRKERREGACRREFYLPGIDSKGIQAKYDNGILTVRLPRNAEQSGGTRIDIE